MKVLLEVSSACVQNPSGIYRYTRQLSRALIFQFGFRQFGYVIRVSKVKHRSTLPYWMQNQAKAYEGFCYPYGGAAVLHGMDMRMPLTARLASVVTAMDLAPFRLRDQQISSPRFLRKKRKDYQTSFRRADIILAISQQTADDVSELFGIDPDKIKVTSLGVQPEFRPTHNLSVLHRYGLADLDQRYFFYVGNLSSRKNLVRLLQAYAASSARQDFHLVFSGGLSYGAQAIVAQVSRLGLSKQVHLIGYTAAADLPALYSHSAGFVFPTLYEGFGLPILEAMACGVPVLTGSRGASPEVAGGHALLADPLGVEDIRQQLDRLPDLPLAARVAAQTHAQSFTWAKTAQQTWAGYQAALNRRF